MKKDCEIFINHIPESIESYSKNSSLHDAIIRRLKIIGGAVKNLLSSFRARHPDIPWKQIAGMRDILIHEYFDVDLALTWKVVKKGTSKEN